MGAYIPGKDSLLVQVASLTFLSPISNSRPAPLGKLAFATKLRIKGTNTYERRGIGTYA